MKAELRRLPPVLLVGDEAPGGTYLLRLRIDEAIAVKFGRFRQAQPAESTIAVTAGECVYIGSAMRGLGSRLLRHASRADASQPQPIRAEMAELFAAVGLVRGNLASTGSANGGRPFPLKRLHWHIDYLLEQPTVELTHVIVLRSSIRLETAVADWLIRDPATFIIAPGLGAQDDYGRSHLLGVRAAEEWWLSLPYQLLLLNQSLKPTQESGDKS